MAKEQDKPVFPRLVQYLPSGRPDDTPLAAIVVKQAPGDMLCLSTLEAEVAGVRPVDGLIRHVDDPHFNEYPAQRSEYGAWREAQ